MERYTEEKHPEVIYHAIDVTEPEQLKRKRPLWRRFVRVLLTFVAVTILWSTFAPVFSHTFKRDCGRHHAPVRPPQDITIPHIAFDDTGDAPLLDYTFPPDIKNFWLKQESSHVFTRTEVVGNVIVHSCEKASNISAHFKFDVSDDNLLKSLTIEPKVDGILVKLDPFSLVKQKVNATVYLIIPKNKDYKLDSLRIGTIELNVWLKDTVTTPINSAYISTVSGSATTFGKGDNVLDINNMKVQTVSGNITGEFPLHHALALETTSGDIIAEINSKPLHEKKAWFKTSSVSGPTSAKFVSHLHPRPLYSKHSSVSGDIKVYYPEDWQGGLKLKTTSGHIDVKGKGTEIVKKEKDIVGKFWKVIKGEGKSKGYIGTVSGKIGVYIGELDDKEL